MVRAASGTARNVVSALGPLAGLTSTATRVALGTSSCSRPSRLDTSSWEKKLMPVALPPGRERLVTRPSLTGSSGTANTMGIVVVALPAANEAGAPVAAIHFDLSANEVGHQHWQPLRLVLGP